MQTLTSAKSRAVAPRNFAVRVMLLCRGPESEAALQLAALGCSVEVENDPGAALSAIIDDEMGYDLFVMECDGLGGIAGAERAIAALIAADARMRVMLISRDFEVPVYPMGRRTAVSLPVGFSAESFRFGFEHVLRDRVALHLA